MKVALSQTIFANLATLPVEATGDSVGLKSPPVGPDEVPLRRPSAHGARQYPAWPVTIDQLDNYGRNAAAWLPAITLQAMTGPAVQILDADSGKVIYTLRVKGNQFHPKILETGAHNVHFREPGMSKIKVFERLRAKEHDPGTLEIRFD